MRLAEFIRQHRQPIIDEWATFAKSLAPAARMTPLQLQDHIGPILTFIASDIESAQSSSQQVKKSHGKGADQPGPESAAKTHGSLRHDDGFDIVQMVSEYRALRGSVIKLWTKAKTVLADEDLIDLTRFNEAIDQALAESVATFMEQVNYSRDLLLGILGHDLRSPVGAMQMSGMLLPMVGPLNEEQAALAEQIGICASRVNGLVGGLLEIARARRGASLPVVKAPMDMEKLARQMIGESNLQHPTRPAVLEVSGEVRGEWDAARMGQLFSNLLGNAVQYGTDGHPIRVAVEGREGEIVISIRNESEPIPASQLATIFDSFTRGDRKGGTDAKSTNLGLGLFITKEIVTAHGGTIDIVSNAAEGTTFVARLPR